MKQVESIIQEYKDVCYLCGRSEYESREHLDKHHVFGAALRKKSEEYGATVYLCHLTCHLYGENAVHKNAGVNNRLKAYAQAVLMDRHGWTVEDFRKEFYKNYL